MFDRFFDFILSFIELFYVTVVVQDYERAVVLRLGRFKHVLEPGIHFRFPLNIDKILKVNIALETKELPAQALTTKDGKPVVASAVASIRINDARKFLIETEEAESVLADSSRGTIRRVIAQKTWDELQSIGEELDNELTKAVRRKAFTWGIEVIQVTLSDLTLVSTYRVLLDGNVHISPVLVES